MDEERSDRTELSQIVTANKVWKYPYFPTVLSISIFITTRRKNFTQITNEAQTSDSETYRWTLRRNGYRPAGAEAWCSASAPPWSGGSQVHPEPGAGWCPHPQPPGHTHTNKHTIWVRITHRRFEQRTELLIFMETKTNKASHFEPVRGSCKEAPGQTPQSCAGNYWWELSLWTYD